ncbi:hypothetical protein ZHAS_00007153 [Anopheles sinensis]|uniref:HMG box domain-containing protein n=1 Tax=Anopheles sinensis TaxID=74873 RepID=A0A084VP93_ANOSI|nr:hypothetical protein ZHAS_00007153 [Anopheles sinensis]
MPHPEDSKQSAQPMAESWGEPSSRRNAMTCNPGRKSRNPYINYLREFRRQNCHLSAVEVVRQGAERWRKMTDEQKLPYIRTAFYTPMRPMRRCPACRMAASRSRRATTVQSRRRDTSRSKRPRKNGRQMMFTNSTRHRTDAALDNPFEKHTEPYGLDWLVFGVLCFHSEKPTSAFPAGTVDE